MKKAALITGAALGLLVLAAVGAFAYGGMWGGYGPATWNSTGNFTPGQYHDQMAQVLESGTFADLQALRQETGMPMMPWIQDEATFQQAQQQYAENGFGPGMMGGYGNGYGGGYGMMGNGYGAQASDGSRGNGPGYGRGFGDCPMRNGD